jgi:hypothetical protein
LSSASRCWLLFGAIAIWVVTIGSGIVIGGRVGREIDKAAAAGDDAWVSALLRSPRNVAVSRAKTFCSSRSSR